MLSVSGGGIREIQGLDAVRAMDCVYNVIQVKFPGDSIQGQGGSAQVIAYALLVVDDKDALRKALDEITMHVHVTGSDGQKMELIHFDVTSVQE